MVTTRTVIAGHYELDFDTPIGSGGTALVYRGRDLRSHREVAIKTLRPEYASNPESRARFRREARNLAFVKHPGLVTIYDLHEEAGNAWVIMEYVPGPTLKAMVRDEGPMAPEEVYPILKQLAGAFTQIHGKGLVHLDIKPQNIIVRPDGVAKLIDFGLAQAAGKAQDTENGVAFGTVAYLAPERATGERVDVATDVYSLGCVIYEMLTGRPPFDAPEGPEHQRQMIQAHLHETPVAPSKVRADLGLPAWVDDVVGWAIAKSPRERYHDVATFERMFLAGLEGEIVPRSDLTEALPSQALPLAIEPTGRIPVRAMASVPVDDAVAELEPVRRSSWGRMYRAGGRAARRTGWLRRAMWKIAAMLLVANLLLGSFLLVRDGPAATVEHFLSVAPGSNTSVSVDRVNLRESPGMEGEVIAVLGMGTSVDVTGLSITQDGEQWWPVRVDVNGQMVDGYIYDGGLRGNQWTGRLSWMQGVVDEVDAVRRDINGAWDDVTGLLPF
jgi:serine/threonine-protein kinase